MLSAPVLANVEQAEAWDGDEGDHWTDHEERYDRVGTAHDSYLFAGARIGRTDHVLDVGCGCGRSTREAARQAQDGQVVGLDLSRRMIERARQRSSAEAIHNVTFQQADAQVHFLGTSIFDVVISRFGAMFFIDPVTAWANIARAMRPRGRVSLLTWQPLRDNEWLMVIRQALAAGRALPEPSADEPGPFGLADPDAVHRILTAAGLEDVALRPVNEPLNFGTDAEDAFTFVSGLGMARGLLNGLDDADRARSLDALQQMLALHETPDGVLLGSSSWQVTARRA